VIHKLLTDSARNMGIPNFYDEGHGICHRVIPEEGHVRPGMLIVGADSHTTTYGALGAAATGIGMSEMAYVLALGRLWFMVPPTVRFELSGTPAPWVTAKDLVLYIAGRWGAEVAQYKSMEFAGEGCSSLDVESRMTVCNRAVELGAKCGMFPADGIAEEWLRHTAGIDAEDFGPDPGAEYESTHCIDLASIEPMAALPHSVDKVAKVSELGEVKIDQAVLGGCTNGHLSDLRLAAKILEDRKVMPGVRFLVVPASRKVELLALREGVIETLLQAGAILCPPTCGNCFGSHVGILAPGQVCVSATNRNFRGRMGSYEAEIYLASPATVAASAAAGKIVDPRES